MRIKNYLKAWTLDVGGCFSLCLSQKRCCELWSWERTHEYKYWTGLIGSKSKSGPDLDFGFESGFDF